MPGKKVKKKKPAAKEKDLSVADEAWNAALDAAARRLPYQADILKGMKR